MRVQGPDRMVVSGRRSPPNLLDSPPARVFGEAKGGILPDPDGRFLCVAARRRCWGVRPRPDKGPFPMPTHKDLKRLVRARMRRTGEAYTTARAHLLARKTTSPVRPATAAPALDYAARAGKSDATLQARTGCTWERWVYALDRVAAHEWSHRAIAAYVRDTYRVTPWWSQMVAVGYERIKGLRVPGQRHDGRFAATRSKVVAVPVERLYRACRDPRTRRHWLGEVELAVRTAVPGKTIRAKWPDGTSLELYFEGKGLGKSQVSVEQLGLADAAAVTRAKAYWGERLAALETLLVRRRG